MNRRSAMRKIKRFFTLVEMIVAMAVMIFVALIIATASMTFYNAWQRTVRVSDRLKTCQAIDRIMDNCIRNMIPFRWKDKDLDQIINDAADKFEITLNEDQFNQLKALLEKLGGLNLDLGSLKSQAQAAYDTLKDMGFDISKIHIDTEEAKGIFQQIIDMIKGWFN